jgi:copper chaperone NosL
MSRIVLLLCAAGLAVVLFVPLWTIDLVAPQYPEGLQLVINPDGLAGNVDIINGLNHYIGMKTLHTDDFFEFRILPYIIGAFAVLFAAVAIIGRKKLLYILLALYLVFGVVSMYDFWKWEYDYGHNLDETAAIKVPGMAYQPPLIGYKQLLNFSAYSMPATGGWIFLGVGAITLALGILEFRRSKKNKKMTTTVTAAAVCCLLSLQSCSTEAESIKFGTDNCYACKMTISDKRFGGELVTKKGKVFKFDDSHCLLEFLKSDAEVSSNIANTYLVDFAGEGQLVNVNSALLYKSTALKTPMGGDIAAFSSKEALLQVAGQHPGTETSWNEVSK